jgi:hypothetical protein
LDVGYLSRVGLHELAAAPHEFLAETIEGKA